MPLKLSGLSASPATVTVTQGGRTSTVSTSELGATLAFADQPSSFVRTPTETLWNGVTATVSGWGNGARWGSPTYPHMFIRTEIVDGVSGSRILLGLNDFTLTAEAYVGGRADVYRMVNGELTFVRSSDVVGGDFSSKHVTEDLFTAFTQAGGYGYRLPTFARPDHTYYFGIAALDGGGQIGEVGWTSGYNPGVAGQGDRPENANSFALGAPFTEGGPLGAPTGVIAVPDAERPATVSISWNPVPGAIGYIPFVAYQDPVTHPDQTYLELADDGGPPVQIGDMVTITNKIRAPHADMMSARAYGAASARSVLESGRGGVFLNTSPDFTYQYEDFDETDPAPAASAGTTFLRQSINPGVGSVTLATRFWHGSPTQTFYTVLDLTKTYRFRVWARASRPHTMSFLFNFSPNEQVKELNLTTEWQEFTIDGVPDIIVSGGARAWSLTTSTTGQSDVVVDIAAIRLHDTSARSRGFFAEDIAQMPRNVVLRDHNLIKDFRNGSDVESLTNPPGCASGRTSLDDFLWACLDARAQPWIQIEWYLRSEDWRDIMAYLGAPVSSGHPMALKRAAQGRVEPWTDAFERVLFEFGNESWNGLTGFRRVPSLIDAGTGLTASGAVVYGAIARRAALAMEASPYWSPKIEWVLGGRARNVYGAAAAERFRRPARVGVANYNGGWDVGNTLVKENDSSYQAVLAVVSARSGNVMETNARQLREVAAAPGSGYVYNANLWPTCYEAGPGYQLNGLNGASVTDAEVIIQEVVMKSRAAATGTLDTFCAQALVGFSDSNFFVLGEGDYWNSRASDAHGGSGYSSWEINRILHTQIAPARAFDVGVERNPVSTVVDNGDVFPFELIYTYGFENLEDPTRKVLVIGNRSVDQTIKPRIFTPFAQATSCTVWANVGNLREHNRYPPGTRLATTIRVDGANQTGDSLTLQEMAFAPQVGETFTIDGDETVYTVTDVTGFAAPGGSLGITPDLAASPDDRATVTWSSVIDGFAPDPLCVDIDLAPVSVPVPADLESFEIDETLGATVDGLPPGCCVMILFEGTI